MGETRVVERGRAHRVRARVLSIAPGSWTPDAAPGLDGKVAIVTGSTGGLGFETALGLARRGATTILAARDPAKGEQALARILGEIPAAKVRFEQLDLASLASIARFAAAQRDAIDILVNNAGVMGLPTRQLTEDGFERQIGVNLLGHFALTGRLKDALCAAPGGGRVVTVASLAHRRVDLDLDDLQSERSYQPRHVYGVSKLSPRWSSRSNCNAGRNRNGWNLTSLAAHPGWARTDIVNNGIGGGTPGLKAWLMDRVGFWLVAQPARDGALPSLYAARWRSEAKGGAYYGPTCLARTARPARSGARLPAGGGPGHWRSPVGAVGGSDVHQLRVMRGTGGWPIRASSA